MRVASSVAKPPVLHATHREAGELDHDAPDGSSSDGAPRRGCEVHGGMAPRAWIPRGPQAGEEATADHGSSHDLPQAQSVQAGLCHLHPVRQPAKSSDLQAQTHGPIPQILRSRACIIIRITYLISLQVVEKKGSYT